MNNKIEKAQRKLIKDFVFSTMEEYDLERDDEYELGFKTYNAFKKKNNEMIKLCTNDDIIWLTGLIDRINNNKLRNMDKQYMIPFETSGFCWNKEGNLVIFNER